MIFLQTCRSNIQVFVSNSVKILRDFQCLRLVTVLCLILNLTTVKGTHTVYFSSSLYIINQKPIIPRTHNCITTWVASSSG